MARNIQSNFSIINKRNYCILLIYIFMSVFGMTMAWGHRGCEASKPKDNSLPNPSLPQITRMSHLGQQ